MALLSLRGHELGVCWRQGRWVVLRRGQETRTLRPAEVSAIHCLGPVDLTPSARAAALARGVPVVFLTADGRYRGRLEGARGPTGALHRAQVTWLEDPVHRASLAREVVAGKLDNQRTLLLRAQRRHADPRLTAAACSIRAMARRARAEDDRQRLLGMEGEGARLYFSAWPALISNPEFSWSGRTKRPPRDAVNACLSYAYTLLSARADDAVRTVGLLPGVGALHESGRGAAALVFDLVEEFRAPFVDRVVLRLVNRRQLAPEDFEDPAHRTVSLAAGEPGRPVPSGAVYLGAAARRLLTKELQRTWREDLPDAVSDERVKSEWLWERQARRIARVVQGKEPDYRPFQWG